MVDLHELASKGEVEKVRKFLGRHAAKVNKTNRDGQTALHLAAKGGHVEVCRELIASVANVDAEDKKHRTPLQLAVKNNKAQVARALCEAGASTSLANPADGRTPLHVAANKGFTNCAEVLLQCGAAVDGNPDKWGHVPDDDCATSEIRLFIEKARKDRAAATTCSYAPCVATAPPSKEAREEASGLKSEEPSEPLRCREADSCPTSSTETHPSYDESISLSQFGTPQSQRGAASNALSPLSQARQAEALGGDCCAGCSAPERARQLTPCHHVVCNACVRRARDEEEGCPLCHCRVFDDNPLFM